MAISPAPKGRLTRLRMKNFKSFADADLKLGPLTVLVGTNASGKSNIRDAFRFLHGISRGYTVAEIIGEKWIEGGVLQWRGIRGGVREIASPGAASFELAIEYQSPDYSDPLLYNIEVAVGDDNVPPGVVHETFYRGDTMLFESSVTSPEDFYLVSFYHPPSGSWHEEVFASGKPVLVQLPTRIAAMGGRKQSGNR